MSWAMWVTGRPGSGKSTVARAAAARLAALGDPVVALELDAIRRVLTPTPTESEAERETVHRALVFMAVALTEAGVPVVIDATGHRRAWRDLARASIAQFAEIQLACPAETVRARAPRLAEVAAAVGGAATLAADPRVTYEDAEAPELTVDTSLDSVAAAVERIAELRRALGPSAGRPGPPGAVIWITGPPGSGKTAQASRLADALAAERVAVKILEWSALRATVLGGGCGSAADEEIAHRALAYTAKLLADAGVTVVVDATAPRRAWRALARDLAPAFAEVQLVCPPEVCLSRERTARWGPRPCPHRGGLAPDIVLDYEYSLSPDLVLDTATRSEWAAGEDVLRLARRLLRRHLASQEDRMTVRDIMTSKPITIDPTTPILDARQRMADARIRHLIVTEDARVVGIITDRDIRLNLPSPATSLSVWEVNYLLARLTVGEVMTRSVMVIDPDRPTAEAARIMVDHKIGALPVVEGGRLTGIVTESDFVRAAAGIRRDA
jgi:adenylylsulfate kinase-like enzyme/CBS domain-containing protein